MKSTWWIPLLLAAMLMTLTACAGGPFQSKAASGSGLAGQASGDADGRLADGGGPNEQAGGAAGQPDGRADAAAGGAGQAPANSGGETPASGGGADAEARQTVAEPDAVTALVNKRNKLPDAYEPDDLVYPDVKFTFREKIEKRMMRKEAADALEGLFAAAKKDGLPLAGVSAYRSFKRQKELFDRYVREDGLAKAETYSAYPGTSEHETGLAIDVSGADGTCQATACFADKPEAAWLAEHAHEYGFIIRYPKGKEAVTGYVYEPWHLRYVGEATAAAMYGQGLTLEEYEGAAAVTAPGGDAGAAR
ncbi:M15 family metallopeptidase [Paenibacillus sp. GCM10023250]|uniref:M15 family metallopeptidase n=1 Tax=Paenibacillus sp. GCM10023250 TaxID=3252648 RepID=UPI00360CEF04